MSLEEEENVERTSMLSERRQEEINNVLTETNVEPMNICDALLEYDETILTTSICKKLMYLKYKLIFSNILPTEYELNLVNSFEGDIFTLKDCDHFILLKKIVQGFDLRLRIIYFKNTYDEEIKIVNELLESAFDLVIFLKECEKFVYFYQKMYKYKNLQKKKDNK